MKNCISVVIATYNRSQSLAKALESFLSQDMDGSFDYELIIVDNNSKDGTKETVASLEPRFRGRLHYFFEPKQGKPYALNHGIREAKGSIIAFTDDDVVFDPQWLKEINNCFQKHVCDGVGGRVLPLYPHNTAAWIKENPHELAGAVVICDFGEGGQPFNSAMEKFIGANYAFKRAMFSECGLFKADLIAGDRPIGEDTEFIQRLLQANKKLYYCGRALVWHPVDLKRLSLGYLARWHFNLGKIAAKSESKEFQGKMSSWGGIPRYLLKGIIADCALVVLFCWNKRKAFRHFRGLFRKAGMVAEYRSMPRKAQGADYAQS